MELAIMDILLRMKEYPYGVRYVKDGERPMGDFIETDAENEVRDKENFFKAWGENPEDRIKAKKLIRLSYDLKKSEGEEAACGMIRKALEIDPGYPDANREMGALLLQMGEVDDAGGYLETAWLNDKDNAATGLIYALYKITGKREDEALLILQELADKDEGARTLASIYFNMGRCYRRLGNNDEAVRHFRQALQIDRNYVQALKEMFAVYMDRNDYVAALTCTEKIVKLQPDNAEVVNDMGVLLYTLGRGREAFEVLTRAVRLRADYKEAVINLRQVAESLGIPIEKELKQYALTTGNGIK